MKIQVLMENNACSTEFGAEHGLSLFIETKKHKILFDMGQTTTFADNAEVMGVDLNTVEMAFLSHAHYDHGGGLRRFLEVNDHAPVYLSRHAFGTYFYREERYTGIDSTLKDNSRLIYTGDNLVIDDELTLCSCNDKVRPYPTNASGLTEKVGDTFIVDKFNHEQYLMIDNDGQKVLISGCSHKGILNIMEWMKPDVLIGGFHFMRQDVSTGKNEALDQAGAILAGYDTKYYTCHCTGKDQFDYLKPLIGDKLEHLHAGQILEL